MSFFLSLSLTRLKNTMAMYSQTTKWAYGSRVSTVHPTSGPWKRPVSAVVSANTSILPHRLQYVQIDCDLGWYRWGLVNSTCGLYEHNKMLSVLMWFDMLVTIAPFSSLQADLSQEMHVKNPEQLYILWKKGKDCRSGMWYSDTISDACKMLSFFLSKWTVDVQARNKNLLNS